MTAVRLHKVEARYELLTVRDFNLKRRIVDLADRRQHHLPQVIQALRSVTLDLNEGTRLGLVGANGAGKSTLLAIMAGVLPPTSGTVHVSGRVMALLGGASAGLDQEATGRENIVSLGVQLGEFPTAMLRRVEEVVAFSGLGKRADHPVYTYSTGMQARLRFSVLTSLRPDVLLLDEGLGTADAEFTEQANQRLQSFVASAGILVLASHSEHLLRESCETGLWLDRGIVRSHGSLDEVLAEYRASSLPSEPARSFDAADIPSTLDRPTDVEGPSEPGEAGDSSESEATTTDVAIGGMPRTGAETDHRSLRMLAAGTCQLDAFVLAAIRRGHKVDHHVSSIHEPVPSNLADANKYDVCVLAPVLRRVMEIASGEQNELFFWRLDEVSEAAYRASIQAILREEIAGARNLMLNRPLVVVGFLEPSFLYPGVAFRFDQLDVKEFIHAINRDLAREVRHVPAAWFIDPNIGIDAIGREGVQDDVLCSSTHASLIGDWDVEADKGRLVQSPSPSDLFQPWDKGTRFGDAVVRDIETLMLSIAGDDKVKLIVLDLDDTLWRGVAAEDDFEDLLRREGWPLGFVEALLVFKRRGGLLAIASKNDEAPTRKRFARIWGARLTLDDFVSVHIGWGSKADALGKILQETNLLARNVVFVDDNPRELDEVRASFPEIGDLGQNHYLWRTKVLKEPRFQTPSLSSESARRTELVRASASRALESSTVGDRSAWLRSLEVEQEFRIVRKATDPDADRCFELLNKTNQFNTTGKRWSIEEFNELLVSGGTLIGCRLRDNTVDNGLVGVAVIRNNTIQQTVLSCRVFGLGAELGLLSFAAEQVLRSHSLVHALLADTGRNFACHGTFAALGFEGGGSGVWTCDHIPAAPDWIRRSGQLDT
jgi:FkbH-like protein